jgi:hypothetical protein
MKRSLSILTVLIVSAILSGCILSKTPNTNEVNILLGDQMTFSVNVFPPNATYSWTLDDDPLSNTGKSYVYTAQAGEHILVVKVNHFLGTDTQTWNITCDPISVSGNWYGTYHWDCGNGLAGSGEIQVTLSQTENTELVEGVISYADETINCYGWRFNSPELKEVSLTYLGKDPSPDGMGLMLIHYASGEIPYNEFGGFFVDKNTIEGMMLNGLSNCSAAFGPSGEFTLSRE